MNLVPKSAREIPTEMIIIIRNYLKKNARKKTLHFTLSVFVLYTFWHSLSHTLTVSAYLVNLS